LDLLASLISTVAFLFIQKLLGGGGLPGTGLGTLTETILEPPADNLQVTHATSSCGLPADALFGPVVVP